MSKILRELLNWSFSHNITPAQRVTLICLIKHANKDGEAFPCIVHLVKQTGLDRKTVVASLKFLRENELITDTGKRIGKTNQVVIYALPIQAQKRNSLTDPKMKPLSVVERVPKTDHGSRCTHRQKKPLAKKVKFAPALRLVVGGE